MAETRIFVLAAVLAFAGCSDSSAHPDPAKSGKPSASASSSAAAPAGELKELDTSALTPNEKKELYDQLNSTLAPCPEVPVSLFQCIGEKRDCKACLPGAEFLLKQVRAGRTKSDREKAFTGRFDPKAVSKLEIADSPFRGPEKATVTIVEWADFECPVCLAYAPLLDSMVERFPGQVRLVYKFYPLSAHKNGDIAARAGVAGLAQGKFWEMHDALFANQNNNDRTGVEGLAKKLHLDMTQFKKDLTDDETTNRIDRDKKQADDLNLDGTPFIWIDNRKFDLDQVVNPPQDLEAWVKLDIELAGQKPNPPSKNYRDPSGASSAEPDASAAPAVAPSASASAAAGASSATPAASAKPH